MAESIEVQLKKGVLGMCVLALLARGNSYAYEIASQLSHAVGMGEGTIYPLMRRMQTDGLVKTYLEESPSGPPRKYYQLTDAGRASFTAQLAEWRGFTASVEQLIAGQAERERAGSVPIGSESAGNTAGGTASTPASGGSAETDQ